MFQQTLDDAARGWFDSLPRGSVDGWETLCEKFEQRFALQRKCIRDPTEITKITRLANEALPEFKERWTDEASRISGVPEIMQISSFIDGCKCPELSKRFSEKIPRTVTEMMIRVDDFIRSEKAYRTAEVPRREKMDTYKRDSQPYAYNRNDQNSQRPPFRGDRRRAPKEILATEHQLRLPASPSLRGRSSRENMDKYCDYHVEKGHLTNDCHNLKEQLKKAMETERAETQDIEPEEKWMNAPISFPPILPGDVSDEPLIIEAEIEGYTVRRVYVDQGASVEVMYEQCFLNLDPSIRARLTKTNTPLVGFAREAIKPLGKIKLEVCFGSEGLYRRTTMKFAVVRSPSPYNVILGRSSIKELRAIPSTIHAMMKFPTPRGVATLVTRSVIISECRKLEEKFLLRKETEVEVPPVAAVISEDEKTEEIWFHPAYPDQLVTIGRNFSPEGRKRLINLLKNSKDVFAWEPSDMTGPVAQKKRFFSEEKNPTINKDVEEWLKAGIIRAVQYPTWISNPALVKKPDDSWRMCIDFKNLNSSCQKDYYPLPEIEWKIESVIGFKYKCFLNAYKGYHQVQMAKEDEEKTAFYTNHGTYCYVKMPFGLKNARATYQKLVDTAFRSQIGRNLEAYVDDMVIKSRTEKELLADISETFDNLREINMKLNPKKCSFGVEEGKFLGYMVTSEGIRANPKKTRAIADMQSPKSLKEMQSLSGKLAALNRFLSKSAERSLPFFETLKSITKENRDEYRWIEGAERAFQEMKKMILELPCLTTPTRKEDLYLYLAATKEAISGVILVERDGRHKPVHYVSRTLHEAEKRYAPVEKLALALLHLSRRLRRYFEAHLIKVITDQPIKQILSKAEASGRLAKYTVELGAYNITYLPRNVIKGHVLADFINEIPIGSSDRGPKAGGMEIYDISQPEEWVLYTDGASSKKGVDAGLYEALLAGLRIAKDMHIRALDVRVDSNLVASQINGDFTAYRESMTKYLAKAKEYIACFEHFKIKNIPRAQNQKADILSKVASVAFDHLTKEILVEVLEKPSTEEETVNAIVEEEEENWMLPIVRCLKEGIWPEDQNEARDLRMKISHYTMINDVLFKKSYLGPMLRYTKGLCGMHSGPRSVVAKLMRQGYYWPTMHRDTREVIRKCDSCQIHAPVPKLPKTVLTSAMAPWPFYQWAMDVLGPLPEAPGKVKYVILAIDYFTKWMEAKPLAKTTGKEINTAVAHPQANGLVERANKSLMKGFKSRLGRERTGWVDELPNVLWAFRTSLKTSNGETPFSLTYGSEAVIPAEIGMPTFRTMMTNARDNDDEINLNLNLLEERREMAAIREAKYKKKVEQYYNRRVCPEAFKVGDFVYRKNEASRVEDQGKLGPNWEGPYRIIEAYQHGTYKLQTMDDVEVPRTWHAINLKKCFMPSAKWHKNPRWVSGRAPNGTGCPNNLKTARGYRVKYRTAQVARTIKPQAGNKAKRRTAQVARTIKPQAGNKAKRRTA
ncbi:reverse transcriptase domain-containing protein [Artemisia annua]|uniref:Reverse transcriptase domain-containing protein n=1 Tax=Artemisia annua TaxID=35608 RepID=A0A2U1NQF9_ARTAN|nr:reverse transcriptase domain-containing protein [Artemisia annua]